MHAKLLSITQICLLKHMTCVQKQGGVVFTVLTVKPKAHLGHESFFRAHAYMCLLSSSFLLMLS